MPDDIVEKWRSWKEELLHVHKIKIPRYFAIDLAKDAGIELHAFGDASPKVFGPSVYVRVQDVTGQVKTALLMAKSCVAPVKKITLPRLELLAAFVNSRLLYFIVDSLNNLKISQVLCWTDSSITLYWIQDQMLHGNRLLQTGYSRSHQCGNQVFGDTALVRLTQVMQLQEARTFSSLLIITFVEWTKLVEDATRVMAS